MYGIVLAGGTGTRLYPLTKVTNKHLLPIGNKPMIYYPINKLIQAGMRDIIIVSGIEHLGSVVSLLGSGVEFGCDFTYKVQDKAGGIAEALGLVSNIVKEKMVIILGDNIFLDDLSPYVNKFKKDKYNARVLLKKVRDPSRFGVPVIKNGKIIEIKEKPENPSSNYCVTGIYMYNPDVFDMIKKLKLKAEIISKGVDIETKCYDVFVNHKELYLNKDSIVEYKKSNDHEREFQFLQGDIDRNKKVYLQR